MTRIFGTIFTVLMSMAAMLSALSLCAQESDVKPFPEPDRLNPASIVVVGDLQRTTWMERAFLGRRQNDSERDSIVAAVVREHPDLLLLLGDYVASGSSSSDWERFDALMENVRELEVPICALVGNHEYGVPPTRRAVEHCYQRFPRTRFRPDTVRLGRLMLLTFDSNFDRLSPATAERQARNYRELLEQFDADTGISAVVVAAHHPPYTGSDLAVDQRMTELYTTPFLNAHKTLLFLSGHVHAYERFDVQGKCFVVSGGGGGPRRAVQVAEDDSDGASGRRNRAITPFHYLRISVEEDRLNTDVMLLVDDGFQVGDRFSLKMKDSGTAPSDSRLSHAPQDE